MINTPAFESLMRLKKLKEALDFLKQHTDITQEHWWMLDAIRAAMEREEIFANNNREQWQKEA